MIATNPLVLAQFRIKNGDFGTDHKIGLVDRKSKQVLDITGLRSDGEVITSLQQIFEWTDRVARLNKLLEGDPFANVSTTSTTPKWCGDVSESYSPENKVFKLDKIEFESPIPSKMPVWCAGVTYLRSRDGRNDETIKAKGGFRDDEGRTVYDKVYETGEARGRPELFFKANGEDTMPHAATLGIREDEIGESVMEPEFTLVINSRGEDVGFTIGNDMSARDMEGENPLYLPQAKVYKNSCGIGPVIVLADDNINEKAVRNWKIKLDVVRNGKSFDFKSIGVNPETLVGNISRSFDDLEKYLMQCNYFENGVALLTGTGIVPPKGNFKLQEGDIVKITIDGIGTLVNKIKTIPTKLTAERAKELTNERMPDLAKVAIQTKRYLTK